MFTNVGKGKLAKSEELKAAFGTDDQEQIVLEVVIALIIIHQLKSYETNNFRGILFADFG